MSTMKKQLKKIIAPVLRLSVRGIINYPNFWRDLSKYKKMAGAEKIKLVDIFPILDEKTPTTMIDPHYFIRPSGLLRKYLKINPQNTLISVRKQI